MRPKLPCQAVAVLGLLALAAGSAECAVPAKEVQVAGWPQFHGPRRDNLSSDRNLLKRWPEGGPRLVWQVKDLGHGWATVAIAGGMIYTAGKIGPDMVITALDMSGNKLWQATNGHATKKSPHGARATPTIADGKLYHLNGDGDVVCLDAKTGKPVWTLNILEKFQGRNIQWALSESLLVDGSKVICCPGGEKVSVAALDKDTGETVWTCTGVGDKPAYTSPMAVDYGGLRQIVTSMSESVIGVEAATGRLLWKYPHKVASGANCATPIHDDGRLFVFGTWGRGATMLKLHVQGGNCTVEEGWRTKDMDNEHGGVVLVDGHLYGQADGNHKKRHWACLDPKTGATMWSADEMHGTSGTLTYADGMLYLVGDRRKVALVPASPKAFEIVSRFEIPKQGRGPTWAHPVVFGGRLYIRHDQFLYAYDVHGNADAGAQ